MIREGKPPHIVVTTDGEHSHDDCCSISKSDIIKTQCELMRNALSILGVPESHIHTLSLPDGDTSFDNQEIGKLRTIISQIKPVTILVPHWGKRWSDHLTNRDMGIQLASDNVSVYEYCKWMWLYNVWRGLDWKNAFTQRMTSEEYTLKLHAIDSFIKLLAPCGRPWNGVLAPTFLEVNQ